jgi:hypothetical protein
MKAALHKYHKNGLLNNKTSATSDDDVPLGQTMPKTKPSAGPNGKLNGINGHDGGISDAMSEDEKPLVSSQPLSRLLT